MVLGPKSGARRVAARHCDCPRSDVHATRRLGGGRHREPPRRAHGGCRLRRSVPASPGRAGDARAAFLLGTRFASGRGAARDDSEAFRWFERAAEAGVAEARHNLEIMYASGRGVVRNMAAAARWYEEAASQSIAEAPFDIGTLYALGAGVEKDEVRAAEWLQRAANKSLPQAQLNLGVLHEHGRGVRLDARMAMAWYRRAAKQRYPTAMQRLEALQGKFAAPADSAPLQTGVAIGAEASAGSGSAAEGLGNLEPGRYLASTLERHG
ncbi:MAG TPA: tetratricopeptide repeat protein [Gammaproteobacteria bacterium]|nr:tetratricopeptide repeat protein [Gammaproteobacteria bacterium]